MLIFVTQVEDFIFTLIVEMDILYSKIPDFFC